MAEIEQLKQEIQKLREHLAKLLQEEHQLSDPEMVSASQRLDKVLNEYEKLLKKQK